MLRFYYNKAFKYTNRRIIASSVLSNETYYKDINYLNIDSPDSITGHIIYIRADGEELPTYIKDSTNEKLWYVSGITQLRTKKYQLSLIRDILSEVPYNWKQEKAYINAGMAVYRNYNQYKTWGLPYTNTKLSSSRLNINGKSSYFVFYVNETEDNGHEVDLVLTGTANAIGGEESVINVNTLNDIPGYTSASTNNTYLKSINTDFRVIMSYPFGGDNIILTSDQTSYVDVSSINATKEYTVTPGPNMSWNGILPAPEGLNKTLRYPTNTNEQRWRVSIGTGLNAWNNYMTGTINNVAPYSNLLPLINNYLGKTIKTADGKYYKLELSEFPTNQINVRLNNNDVRVQQLVQELATSMGVNKSAMSFVGTEFLRATIIQSLVKVTAVELANEAIPYSFTLPANKRKLPKSGVRCINIVADGTGGMDDTRLEEILQLAQTNVTNGREVPGSSIAGRILDIQKLPFRIATPTQSASNIIINNSLMTATQVENDDLLYETNTTVYTSNKEVTRVRLVSPTYKTQFEYSPYLSNNNTKIDVKITLRPYQSSIYIRPTTVGLLLNDFDDKNCMIIEEDFSLTKVTNAWSEYVLQNKNFQSIFDRQVQGRELEQSWERRVEQAQAKADNWNARNISADRAKTYTGNLPIIGNVAGAIGTGFQNQDYMEASRLDREYAEALRQESMSMARDMFQMQNSNLKSQPSMPKSITTFDAKTLDGVYVELWGTNPTEMNAIAIYYENNGHRIDDYGTFEEYYGPFVRGRIIQSEYYTQPELNEINRRLEIGIYTEEGVDE